MGKAGRGEGNAHTAVKVSANTKRINHSKIFNFVEKLSRDENGA